MPKAAFKTGRSQRFKKNVRLRFVGVPEPDYLGNPAKNPMRYFKKIYPQNPAILSNGSGFLFPAAASGVGLLAVDPAKRPELINDFERLISRQRGGIVEITAQDFEDEKKKGPRQSKTESLSVAQVIQIRRTADRVNAELADKERAKRQLTPTINRSFKRPGMKFAGATQNPQLGDLQPGQWRPGTSDRP